jgi:sugar/nucleoside kinase (ribokinase family)
MTAPRRGITCAGNWIVDRVKIIDAWPQEERLATIESETRAGGGGAHNVAIDLAKMEAPFPVRGQGVVGTDEDGKWLIQEAFRHAIDVTGILTTKSHPTSYTEVMTVKGSGRRTFFHHPGANALFADEHVDPGPSKILHLAYLLLLESVDRDAARILKRVRATGAKTSVDLVSAESARYREVVLPVLDHVDYLILNEIEAGECADLRIRGADRRLDRAALSEAAKRLRRDNLVVIHMPEGALALDAEGETWVDAKPVERIVGSVGAGDAFAAGLLYGLHEEWPVRQAMDLAHLAAAASLGHETTTGGLRPVSEL